MKEPVAPVLWHYTCEHGRIALDGLRLVKPLRMHTPNLDRLPQDLRWMSDLAWFTDQPRPDPAGLGLALRSYSIVSCDRTAYRYRLDPRDRDKAVWWPTAVRDLPRAARGLALAEDARPATWWIVREPVRVTPD